MSFELLAAIGGVAELTLAVFSNLYRYYRDILKAPKYSDDIRRELGVMLGVTTSLREAIKQDKSAMTAASKSALENAVDDFDSLLREMEDRVAPKFIHGRRVLLWPFSMDENRHLLERIERYKNTFDLTLELKVTKEIEYVKRATIALQQQTENK